MISRSAASEARRTISLNGGRTSVIDEGPFRGESPVAVENHLIVCIPKEGTIRACRQLLKVLRRSATDRVRIQPTSRAATAAGRRAMALFTEL